MLLARFVPPSKSDVGCRLSLTASSLRTRRARSAAERPLGRNDAIEDWGQQHQVDQGGIKLRSATRGDNIRGRRRTASISVAAIVSHRIERVSQRNDACRQGDFETPQPLWISGAIPPFVMAEHPFSEVGIERLKWRKYVRAALWMGEDSASLSSGEMAVLVNDVEERFVDLADVMEQRHSLDDFLFMFVEVGGLREDERIRGNASNVRACFGVVRVDGIEQSLHAGSREAFRRFAPTSFPDQNCTGENTDREGEGLGLHECADGKIRTFSRRTSIINRRPPASWRDVTSEMQNALALECEGVRLEKPAVAYSPALSRAEYHRRCRA